MGAFIAAALLCTSIPILFAHEGRILKRVVVTWVIAACFIYMTGWALDPATPGREVEHAVVQGGLPALIAFFLNVPGWDRP